MRNEYYIIKGFNHAALKELQEVKEAYGDRMSIEGFHAISDVRMVVLVSIAPPSHPEQREGNWLKRLLKKVK